MDIATAALTPVSEGAATASVSAARFTPDGRGVYLITNRDSEFEQLRRVDLVTGAVEVLTGHIPWDIDSFARSDDGRYLAWVANVDGISRLTVVDVARASEILPPLPDGRIGRIAFDRTGKRLALSLESPQSPRDVFVLELERNAVVRYTRSEAGPDRSTAVRAGRARFVTPPSIAPTASHRQVPAFVYRPTDARTASGAHRHSRRTGVAGRAGVESVHAVPGARNGLRGDRAERARLLGLRPQLPGSRQRRGSRGRGQGHRRAAGVDRHAARPRRQAACSCPAVRTAATCRWRRW